MRELERSASASDFVPSRAAQTICIAFFAVQFFFIAVVCSRDTLWLVAHGLTLLPASAKISAATGETLAEATLAEHLPSKNPVRQSVDFYLRAAGIQAGYSFFAPNVGATSKLIFELQFADGHVEYENAGFTADERGLRFATFMTYVGQTSSEDLRRILINSLAQSTWARHQGLVKIRVILGALSSPSPSALLQGEGGSFEVISSYEFLRPVEQRRAESPAP